MDHSLFIVFVKRYVIQTVEKCFSYFNAPLIGLELHPVTFFCFVVFSPIRELCSWGFKPQCANVYFIKEIEH